MIVLIIAAIMTFSVGNIAIGKSRVTFRRNFQRWVGANNAARIRRIGRFLWKRPWVITGSIALILTLSTLWQVFSFWGLKSELREVPRACLWSWPILAWGIFFISLVRPWFFWGLMRLAWWPSRMLQFFPTDEGAGKAKLAIGLIVLLVVYLSAGIEPWGPGLPELQYEARMKIEQTRTSRTFNHLKSVWDWATKPNAEIPMVEESLGDNPVLKIPERKEITPPSPRYHHGWVIRWSKRIGWVLLFLGLAEWIFAKRDNIRDLIADIVKRKEEERTSVSSRKGAPAATKKETPEPEEVGASMKTLGSYVRTFTSDLLAALVVSKKFR